MATFLTGLEELEAATASPERIERPHLTYLSLTAKGGYPGGKAKVQPLQEIDPNSPAFDESKGLAFMTYYHQSPYNWKRSALCTIKDGACFACEQNGVDKDAQGNLLPWYPRKRYYINFLVYPEGPHADSPTGEPYVAVFHCPTTGNGILPDLMSFYKDNGPVTQAVFTLTRTGVDGTTAHGLTVRMKDEPADISVYETQDARAGGYPDVPYDRQAKFYEAQTPEQKVAHESTERAASTIEW
jgi:hypothetical protein